MIALFRCNKNHKYRFIFAYLHQSLGLTIYGCACKRSTLSDIIGNLKLKFYLNFKVLAMLLGASIDEMNLGSVGYGLLIGWILWLILLITAIEFFDYLNSKRIKTGILSGFWLSLFSWCFHS